MSTAASGQTRAGRSLPAVLLVLVCAASPAFAKDAAVNIGALAGTYQKPVKLYDSSGKSYTVKDVLQVFQCGKNRAYIYTELNFTNYHECSLAGFAKSEQGALVYQPDADDKSSCALRIVPKAGRIVFEDPEQKCSFYCGARGHFDAGDFRIGTRRRITAADKRKIARDIDDDFKKGCR